MKVIYLGAKIRNGFLFDEMRPGVDRRVQCPLPFDKTHVLGVSPFVSPYIVGSDERTSLKLILFLEFAGIEFNLLFQTSSVGTLELHHGGNICLVES